MKIVFSPQAWEDYLHWQTADRAVLKRINKLIARRLPVTASGHR